MRGSRAPAASDRDAGGAQLVRILGACTVSVAPDQTAEEVIAALAEPQRGRVARWQLRDAGVTASAIDRRVRRGRLIVAHPAVYALPGTDAVPHAADAAALLSAGAARTTGPVLLADHSAAVLYRIRPGVADPVHIVIPYGRRGPGRTPSLVVHRSRILTRRDARIHDGLPVTSPARTFLDLAIRLPDRDVERLLAEAIHVLRLLTLDDVNELLGRVGQHPGVPRLARVAGRPAQRTESPPHTALVHLIRQANLEEPETEVDVLGFRVDCFWPRHRLIVEVDGYAAHSSELRFRADRKRDATLRAAGYTVIRIAAHQIEYEPLEVIALLARLLPI